ncbi:MAG TPA: ATP-dependent helicase, partial [Polaromonas sp.]
MQTLTRGDGLLGMKPSGPFGPRGDSVTVVLVDWTYTTGDGLHWETPAPITVLNSRASPTQALKTPQGQPVSLRRDLMAEAEAMEQLWKLGLHPVPADALQWRSDELAINHEPLWSLVQEAFFADFWAEQLPVLQAQGWAVVVRPGFAHESVPVDAWRLVISPETGEVLGKEVAAQMHGRAPVVSALGLSAREGSWLLTLGVEVDGETLDLAPLLADLLRRDHR